MNKAAGNEEFRPGMRVILKKQHPCGSSCWEILRSGADVKIRCTGCGHILMLPRMKFRKMVRSICEDGQNKVIKQENGKAE